jgi:hypothetical protein
VFVPGAVAGERLITRLTQFRRVAPRYETRAISDNGMLTLAAILLWLSFEHTPQDDDHGARRPARRDHPTARGHPAARAAPGRPHPASCALALLDLRLMAHCAPAAPAAG